MAFYTQLDEQEIGEIGEIYGLDPVSYRPFAGGFANSSYLIKTDDEKYVLTVQDDHTIEKAGELISLLNWLNQHQFPTVKVVSPIDEEQPIVCYDGKPLLMKQFVVGEVVQKLTDPMLWQLGNVMAQLHEVPMCQGLRKDVGYDFAKYPDGLGWGIDERFESWLGEQQRYLGKLEEKLPELPMSIVHGDFFYDNVLFSEGELQAVLDFEEASHSYKIFDIGMGLLGLCLDDDQLSFAKAATFLKGYEARRPLKKEEKKVLPSFIVYSAAGFASWRYWKFNVDVPDLAVSRGHWQLAAVADQIRAIEPEKFPFLFNFV